MRSLTQDWLARAGDDLISAGNLLADSELSQRVVFFSVGCVWKCFRAIAEYRSVEVQATYSLTQTARLIKHYLAELDLENISRLDGYNTDDVEQGEQKPVPNIKPGQDEAAWSRDFAEGILKISVEFCKEENDWDSSEWNSWPFA